MQTQRMSKAEQKRIELRDASQAAHEAWKAAHGAWFDVCPTKLWFRMRNESLDNTYIAQYEWVKKHTRSKKLKSLCDKAFSMLEGKLIALREYSDYVDDLP